MNKKIRPRIFSVLLAVMLVSMVAVSAVSAQGVTGTPTAGSGEPALVIGDSMDVLVAGATSVSDMRASGITEPEELNVPKGVTRYDLVTFDHAALSKQVQSVLPLRIHGKEYQAELHRMDFEQIDDGIDSYDGAIVGVGGSDVLLTTGENVLVGSVTFGNETFWIRPIEPRTRVEQPGTSLHIIYSSEDILYPQEPAQVDQGPVTPPEGYPTWQMVGEPEIGVTPAVEQYATVNLLVVTDNQFYQGTDHGRKYVAIHEIGHNLNANHEGTNSNIYNQAYDWWDLGLYHRTVMWSGYLEQFTLLEFSSDNYHGDATHDNARSIREAKWQVAGYA